MIRLLSFKKSFGYFEKSKDEQKAINAMASSLKKGGILIIDFMNVKKVIKSLILSEDKLINNINFKIRRSIVDDCIIKDIKISSNGKHYTFKEKVKALTLIDFSNFITNSKLQIINTFGNYKLEDFNALTSERLIIICKK